ncbi:MAG: PASTA domain-containing protein [Oscillospiraceae bacterium]|nr:PASTA domain-containing protein [Oscillospiraceae bacterium]
MAQFLLRLINNTWGFVVTIISVIYPVISWLLENKLSKRMRVVFTLVCSTLLLCMGIVGSFFTDVPDFTGISYDSARDIADAHDLELGLDDNTELDNSAIVESQNYEVSTIVLKGTKVTILLANKSSEVATVTYDESLPNYEDKNTGDEDDGEGIEDTDSTSDEKDVNEQDETADDSMMTVVPNVVGLEQSDAINLLYLNGLSFQVSWDSSMAYSDVYYIEAQSIEEGSEVEMGTVIGLTLTSDVPDYVAVAVYQLDDASVKNSDELDGFIFKQAECTNASRYYISTNTTEVVELLSEQMYEVALRIDDLKGINEEAIVSIALSGCNVGFVVCSLNEIDNVFYITGGDYVITIDDAGIYYTAYVTIDRSGEYFIDVHSN